MRTNYDELLPTGILFNLRAIENMNLVQVSMMKKLINKHEIECVKIGNKIHVSRVELIRYLEANTIESIAS